MSEYQAHQEVARTCIWPPLGHGLVCSENWGPVIYAQRMAVSICGAEIHKVNLALAKVRLQPSC